MGTLTRLAITGYAVLELNHVAFRRDGRVVAQCELGTESDGSTAIEYVENGMLLAVNENTRTVNKPVGTEPLIALNYTTEHMYDERTPGLNNFCLKKDSFLPRLGYLAAGDKFTTNCIAYTKGSDTGEFADDAAVKTAVSNCGTTALYGQPCANGAIELTATKPTGAVCLQVCYGTTLPNGDYAVKFVSLK